MNILVVGSGGREHVLAWKLRQSPKVKQVFCAPGNGGLAGIAVCCPVEADDISGLVKLAKEKNIDLTIVGPEAPLVAGLVDVFQLNGLKVFGPSRQSAQLEGSKVFAKQFMQRYKIPTAEFKVFHDAEKARMFLRQTRFPVVVKADGLAAGKGVFVCQNLEEGLEAVQQTMVAKAFQAAGNQVIIEECLTGEEVSILAVSDGMNYAVLETSQDHKRIFDDDLGPNTGGMGAYSPAPVATKSCVYDIDRYILAPTIRGMAQEGCPFRGVLYAGLMITPDGPKVLEYNVRFGDPEAQVVIPRLKTDLLDVLLAASEGQLGGKALQWDARSCVCVVMSSGGYPGVYEKGKMIKGLDRLADRADVWVFHAGTKEAHGQVVTSGGRVLGVTALGDNIEVAVQKAYQAVEQIYFDRCFFRRDIGARALKRCSAKALEYNS
ncbi:MAG TPA: phosphoribosylamine--glycine ligase [Candidatus Omnitrophota bacterium]|nr:phosphoribosylamine--glycine ligase [Candidatus Omnitrophota bacterium]HPB68896.1 phosphoribosylamine--glycine ligase [Candidatus Omnitrophota bacterium]HQO58253.1 phosphoribosylamine--glycine ligase [Candidatus Omnitrophota bacterium]HQP11784.1 phosphoribosylamine--glycine ligase [Candidatus Omnitrophota bacterium]